MLTVEKSPIQAPLDVPKRKPALEIEKIQANLATRIVAAKAKMASLATEDPQAIVEVVRETMAEILAQLPEQATEINQIIAAALEGLIQGIILPKRSAIAELQKQIQVLQAQKELEQQKLQLQIHSIFNVVEDSGKTSSASIRTAIELAIRAIEEKKEINSRA
jgi:hypothetical protein